MNPRTATVNLLRDVIAELEMACVAASDSDYCVEIVAKDARRLLARYYRLVKKTAKEAQP
jgi:hypothetical protein